MSRFETRNINKHFGGIKALKNTSFFIDDGEVCGLLGANGSGKTTLSRIIAGLCIPDSGEILFDGHPIVINSSLRARTLGIAMAHQNLSLVNEMTVWENVCLGNEEMHGMLIDNNKCFKEACRVLDLFHVKNLANKKLGDLSPSQKQIVEIAKAISLNPKLLILDEPTAPLEFAQVNILFDIVGELKKKGVAIVFISHRLWEVTKICDKVIILRNGETVSQLAMSEINQEEHNHVLLREITGKTKTKVLDMTLKGKKGDIILKVENLSIKNILKNITFEVFAGETVGISGLQGMGQEELLLALSGYFPRSGQVYFKKEKAKWRHVKQAVAAGIMLVPGDRQKEGLFTEHTVFDNLMYPQFSKKGSDFYINNRKYKQQTDKLMNLISLKPHDDMVKINTLSGGNQQKVVIGKWLNQFPDLLLMSDPAKGIDVEARAEFYAICKKFTGEGKSIVLYTSDTHELVDICDRVLVMFEGRIVSEIQRENLTDKVLIEASLYIHDDTGKNP
jgi:ribose transport system ATP-binding protein